MDVNNCMQETQANIRKLKNEFTANASIDGLITHLPNNCKVLKFSSEFHFNKILSCISKLRSKEFPNLFIFIVEIRSFKTHCKLLDNIETVKNLLSEFGENRPIILQISSKNETVFHVKEEGSGKYFELNEELATQKSACSLSKCLYTFVSNNIGDYEDEIVKHIIGIKNASVALRFLKSLDFSDDFFLKIVINCATTGTKCELFAILDTPFEGGHLNSQAEEYLSDNLNDGSSILQKAIHNPNKDIVNYLISHCTHLIQQLSFEHRVEISTEAFNAQKFNILCDLLEFSDFPFPKDLNARIVNDEKLKKIMNNRISFHNAIKNKSKTEIRKFIKENSNLKIIFGINNQSTLLTCIDSKNFIEYCRLKSLGFKSEVSEKCEDNESLSDDEKRKLSNLAWRQTQKNVSSSKSDENFTVSYLSAKSLIHNRKTSKQQEVIYRDQINQWFKELYKIKYCKELMDAVAQCEDLKIIFDFESDSVENVDLKAKGASGSTYTISKWIFIAAKFSTDHTKEYIRGVVIHEICHYVMRLVYENNEMPYYENDSNAFKVFDEIVKYYNKWTSEDIDDDNESFEAEQYEIANIDSELIEEENDQNVEDEEEEEEFEDDECNGIISSVYLRYNIEDYHPEIIVRPPQILAQYAGNIEKLEYLQKKYEKMFKYFEDFILSELKKFKLRNRENVRKFNKMVGLLPQIVKDNYELLRSKIQITNNEPSVFISNTPRLILTNLHKDLAKENLPDTKNLFIIPHSCENELIFDNFKAIVSENEKIRLIIDCTKGIGRKFKDLLITNNIICVCSNEHHCREINKIFVSKKVNIKNEKVSYSFADLTEESKINLLKIEVNFQNKTNISLLALLNNSMETEETTSTEAPAVDKCFTDIVDEKLLNLLIEKSKTQINSKLELDKNFEILYQSRRFINSESLVEISQEELLKKVENENNVLISDISGNGKSWALKSLALNMMECHQKRWISYIELKYYQDKLDYKKNDPDFLKFMMKNVLCSYNNFEQSVFKRLYKNGKVSILLDGFDEIHNDFIDFAKELISSFKYNLGNQLWITAREHLQVELKEKLSLNVTCKLADFTEQDATELITKIWIIYDLENEFQHYSENELKIRIENFPKLQIYQNHARNLSKKIFNSKFHRTGIPNVCKLAAEIFTGNRDKSCVYELNVENIYDEYANRKCQDWTQMQNQQHNTSMESENETFFSMHQYHAIKEMFPVLAPLCELVYNNVKWKEEDMISCSLLNKKGNNYWFQHDSLKLYFAVSFLSKIFKIAKTELNKTYPDEVVAENLKSFSHSSRFYIIRSFIDLIGNHSQEMRDIKDKFLDLLDPSYNNKDFLEITLNAVGKILAVPHENENVNLVTQLTTNLFGSNKIVKNVLRAIPQMKEFSREFDYMLQNYIARDEEVGQSSQRTPIDIKPEFCLSNALLSLNADMFKSYIDRFVNSYSTDDLTSMLKQHDKSRKNILHICIEKRKHKHLKILWEKFENHFESINAPEEFLKIISQEALPFRYNIFHAAVVYNNGIEFHKTFWALAFETLNIRNDINDILLKNDYNGNNVLHLLLIHCNLEIIDFVLQELQENLDSQSHKTILRSKNSNGDNLLHLAVINNYGKPYLELLWEFFKNSCNKIERAEFVNILMDVNDEGSNIFQLAARFSTSCEGFEFMIGEVRNIGTTDEIKILLKNQDIFKRNLLQSAVRQNDCPECHECFWRTIEEFLEFSEIIKLIKSDDSDDNTMLHNVVAHNTKQIAEITWKKIQMFLEQDEQVEYLRKRGNRRKTIRKISFENQRDSEIVQWVESIYSLTYNKHPHGKPETIITILSDGRTIQDLEHLSKILSHPKVKGRNIVALSMAGAPKTGKSFLLNYCLRYLYVHYLSINNPTSPISTNKLWMDDDDEPLTGFEWNIEDENKKNSLIIWNDVFLPEVKKNQDQIAIIVFDTQNFKGSIPISTKLFDLASLFSSNQVFNLIDVFAKEEQHVDQHILTDIIVQNKLLQNCIILIKDLRNKNANHIKNGRDYLTKCMEKDDSFGKNLKIIEKLSENFDSFLLPYPGKTVATGIARNHKYDGSWCEMDDDFKDELFGFIETILRVENLICRKVNGNKLKADEFLNYIQEKLSNDFSIEVKSQEHFQIQNFNDSQDEFATESNNIPYAFSKTVSTQEIEQNITKNGEGNGNSENIFSTQTISTLSQAKIQKSEENANKIEKNKTEDISLNSIQTTKITPIGKPVNLLLLSSNDQNLTINEEFKNILVHPDVKERKIVIISIVGTSRKGKSFLLNYFLRFLYSHYPSINNTNKFIENHSNWMEDNNEDPLTGFLWGRNAVNNPNGIFFWNDVFLYTNLNDGKELAIVIMDTQASQNESSDLINSSKIFTLSTLISSIQIFNVLDNLEEHNLMWLKSEIETTMQAYQTALNTTSNEHMVQRLLFLIRDWENIDEYQLENGEKYLKEVLQSKKLKTEARYLILSTYKELSCCLLPHPGKVVSTERSRNGKYNGNSTEMDEDFQAKLKEFIETLFKPENLMTKIIKGKEIEGKELLTHLDLILKNSHLKEAVKSFETQLSFEEILRNAVSTLINDYKASMYQKLSNVMNKTELEAAHKNCITDSLVKFDEKANNSKIEDRIKFKKILEQKIEEIYNESTKELDIVIDTFEDEIRNVTLKVEELKELEMNQCDIVDNVQKELERIDIQNISHKTVKYAGTKLLLEKQRLLRYKAEKEAQNCLKEELEFKLNLEQLEILSKIDTFYCI